MKKIVFAIAIFQMAGCTILNKDPYSLSAPKATLTVLSPKLDVQGFQFYTRYLRANIFSDDSGCPWRGDTKIDDVYLYSVKLESKDHTKTIDIPVDKEIFITVRDDYAGSWCEQSIKFKALENSKYSLNVFAHDSGLVRCSSQLTVEKGAEFVPEPTAKYAKPETILKGLFSYDEVCD